MSTDYAPSLKRTEACVVTKVRRLRPPCRVMVSTGQKVDAGNTLAVLEEPGQGHMVILGDTELAMPPDIFLTYLGFDHIRHVVKKTGELISRGEVLARRKPLGMKERVYKSPFDGVVYLLREPGIVGIREIKEVNVTAFIPGQVSHIIPDREIALETPAALVQGTYGTGGETNGSLRLVVDSPAAQAKVDALLPEDKGRILICGASLEPGFLSKAKEIGAKGIVVASVSDDELSRFLGYSPGMITGHERVGITLVITQGFGNLPMLDTTYDILRRFEGRQAFLNGSTQMRAGVIRPEVIVPRSDLTLEECKRIDSNSKAINEGTRVQVLGGQFFGQIGTVKDASTRTCMLETESETHVLEVLLEGNGSTIIPKSNVEPIY